MRRDIVSVIGGGWSFSQVLQDLVPGYVIAVNDSVLHLDKKPDEVVSMDRQWAEHRINALVAFQIPAYLRSSAVQNLRHLIHRPWFNTFECDNESAVMVEDGGVDGGGVDYTHVSSAMVDKPYTLNGTNSGMCAVNRAYVIAARRVYLFGFDMQFGPGGEKHWYPDYDWQYQPTIRKLRDWAAQFQGIARQFRDRDVEVYNVSNRSKINAFPCIWLDELRALKVPA